MSGHITVKKIGDIALGLNIEGCRPINFLPGYCKWFNIIQVIDTPLTGNFLMDIIEELHFFNYSTVEETAGIDIIVFMNNIVKLVKNIKKDYPNLLVHVHQKKENTKLNILLSNLLQTKIIMDDINFYLTPMDYEKFYPNIDAVLSISQCSGFNLSTGCYIVPDSFMEFDTHDNIIYTEKINHQTEIIKYIDFDYKIGSILFVKEQWIPNKLNSDILLLDNKDIVVLNFVKQRTETFDEKNNWHHSINVAKHATKILNNKYVLYLALLHNVCNQKYPDSISRTDLSIWINIYLQEYKNIDEMIQIIYKYYKLNNISQNVFTQIYYDDINPIVQAVIDAI